MKIVRMLAVVLAVCGSAEAQTGGFLEVQTKHPDVVSELVVDGFFRYEIRESLDITSFFWVEQGWAQAYAGPLWKFGVSEVGLSIGVELEGSEMKLRYAASAFTRVSKASFLGVVEANNGVFRGNYGGLWYDMNLKYELADWVSVGLKDRRPSGIGPLVSFKYSRFEPWVSWLPLASEKLKLQANTLLLGVAVNL